MVFRAIVASVLIYDSYLGINRGKDLYKEYNRLDYRFKHNFHDRSYMTYRIKVTEAKRAMRRKREIWIKMMFTFLIAFVEGLLAIALLLFNLFRF